MARRPTTIHLDDAQLDALERLAARESAPVDELVRRAVDRYLATRGDDWGTRFDALVEQVQAQLPPGLTPAQIEVDITAARDEARTVQHLLERLGI